MSLEHRAGGTAGIQQDEHWHQGDDPNAPGYKRVEQTLYQTKILESDGYTYICQSVVGTAESDAKWRIKRIDSNGSTMYADADIRFDNVATDPTALSYSYS